MSARNTPRFAIVALSAGLLVPLAHAEPQPGVNPGNATPAPAENANRDNAGQSENSDRQFVTKAAQGGMLEVKLGELAQQKGSAADVKQFGQRMVDDHGKANAELKQLAQQKNYDLRADLQGEEKEHFDRLSKLNGDDFDRQYITHMIKDHREDIADFEKEARDGKDADVKAWAGKTLPTLKEHLKLIEQVAQAHGVDAARTAGEKQPPEGGNQPNNQGNVGNQPQQPGASTPDRNQQK